MKVKKQLLNEVAKTRSMAIVRYRNINTARSTKDLVRECREALGTVTDLCDIILRLNVKNCRNDLEESDD
jgi:hypothetical protein